MKLPATLTVIAIALTAIVARPDTAQVVARADHASRPAASTSQAECVSTTPVTEVAGHSFYRDLRGSEVDRNALAEHLETIKPLRNFAERLIQDIDTGHPRCAEFNLEAWASSSALLEPPTSFAGLRERQRFTFAINMAALRLFRSGRSLSPTVLDWLSALNRQVADDFQKRGTIDNLYIWSGATAAVAAGLTANPELRRHATNVWHKGIASIGPDGTVPSELRRGAKSLLYHGYYLSGLLILQATRDRPSSSDMAAVARLYDSVRTATCQPRSVGTSAESLKREPPNRDDLATIVSLMPNRTPPCGADRALGYDPLRGGTPKESSAALRSLVLHP